MLLPRSSFTRQSFTSLAFVSLALALFALLAVPSHAEIDKEKADEKAKAEAVGELEGEGADKFDKLHGKLQDDGEQNLREIHELMKRIQNDLANKKTGEPIQKRQTTLIEKIEDLIQKMIQQTQQGGQGSSSQQQNQKPKGGGSKQDQKQSGQQRQNKRDSKMKPGQQKQDQKQGQKNQSEQQKQSEKEKYGPTKHDRKSEGKLPPARPRTLHDVLPSQKQWGLLPKNLRIMVRSSKGKELPSEYRELISSYYKRLSDVRVEKDK